MSPRRADRVLGVALGGSAVVSGAMVLLVLVFLVLESVPAARDVGSRLLTDPSWHPEPEAADGTFGLLPMLLGTGLLTGGALVLAVPAGVLTAIFCRFLAPAPLALWTRRLVELLAGVPSVVYGFWGLVTLVPLVRRLEPPGQSLLAGILVLGLMVLPTVALTSQAALRAVPRSTLDGAAALGLGRWATIRGVALPAALPGIASGAVLATARAVGETMAVLMVCGNVVQVPSSLFDPVRSLTANIALEMGYAAGSHRSSLFLGGAVLMVAVAALVAGFEVLGRQRVADA